MRKFFTTTVLAASMAFAAAADAKDLALSYFMGPTHPMNKAVFTPFAEKLAEISGGELTREEIQKGEEDPDYRLKTARYLINGISL